jgi:hypothetical protein
VVLGIAALAILSWLVLAAFHFHDRYNVNPTSGTLLALADRARDGVLYPALFDGSSYGGTRTMPLAILAYAAAISFAGDYLTPAKVVDLLSSIALVVLVAAVLLRRGAGVVLSLALVSTAVTSQVFLLAATGIRPEAEPTALQLAAVAAVAFDQRRRFIVVAAGFCALALFWKLSALWGPIAIVVWLLPRNRRDAIVFATTFAAASAALFVVFTLASDGRMLTNLLGLGGAGLSAAGAARAPLKTVQLFVQYAQGNVALITFIVLGLITATRHSRPSIFQLGLGAAVVIILIVMADVGSDYNHLLDLIVLLPIVSYEIVQSLAARIVDPRLGWSFLVAATVVASSVGFADNVAPGILAALRSPAVSQPSALDAEPLDLELRGAKSVLADDPYVNLSRGERPVVVDAFMLVRIALRDPALVQPLLADVDDQRFDAVVLTRELDDPDTVTWFRDFAFGLPFFDAVRQNYRLCSRSAGYFVYFATSLACPSLGASIAVPERVVISTDVGDNGRG